jgi:hypothetical protein
MESNITEPDFLVFFNTTFKQDDNIYDTNYSLLYPYDTVRLHIIMKNKPYYNFTFNFK